MRSALVVLVVSSTVALGQQQEAARAARPGTIDGFVTDTNLVPLVDATVTIIGSNIQVVTGTNGRFRMVHVAPGAYLLLVHRMGFEPALANVQVPDADTLRVSFMLQRATTTLGTVRVTAPYVSWKTAEFDARRKAGEGQFVTQEEIEKRNTPWVSGLLEGLRGVAVKGAPRM
jgi:hypothetical protein